MPLPPRRRLSRPQQLPRIRCPLPPGRCAIRRRSAADGATRRDAASRTRIALQALQIGAHFRGALIAKVFVLLHRFVDQLLKLQRNAGVQPHRRHRILVQDSSKIAPELSPLNGNIPVAIS